MKIRIFDTIDSTHTYVKTHDFLEDTLIKAVVQTNGYGRRGDQWESVAGNFQGTFIFKDLKLDPFRSGQLAFVMAVGVGRCLKNLGIHGFAFKWPNDILIENKKLAGLLIEILGSDLIVSLGLNFVKSEKYAHLDCTNWSDEDLFQMFKNVLKEYLEHGFEPLSKEWLDHCAHKDQFVTLYTGQSGVFIGLGELGDAVLM